MYYVCVGLGNIFCIGFDLYLKCFYLVCDGFNVFYFFFKGIYCCIGLVIELNNWLVFELNLCFCIGFDEWCIEFIYCDFNVMGYVIGYKMF